MNATPPSQLKIGIARALALNPSRIVRDERVSALDVSIQAQVINLLRRLRRDLGLCYAFIAHELGAVKHICYRIAVMSAGGPNHRSANSAPAASPAK